MTTQEDERSVSSSTGADDGPPPPVIHSHCATCYDIKCYRGPEPGVACDVIRCPRNCGSRYHGCKSDDHMVLCPNAPVTCTIFGCPALKDRKGIRDHMQRCPANVVMCGEELHRQDYLEHFTTEDHRRCEHQFSKWVEENNGMTIASAVLGKAEPDVLEQFEAMYGVRHVLEKPKNKIDKVDGDKPLDKPKASVVPTKEGNNNRPRYDDLHTVPWQSRGSLTSDSNESESSSLDPSSPDETPSSPFEEDDNDESEIFESLPIIVLQHIGRYLDGKSLSNLAVTSKYLRWVCASLLQEKGMVEMKWEKKDDSWQITKRIWHFGHMSIDN